VFLTAGCLPADGSGTGVAGTRKTLNLCADVPVLMGCPDRHAPNHDIVATPTAPHLPAQVRGVAGGNVSFRFTLVNFINFIDPEGNSLLGMNNNGKWMIHVKMSKTQKYSKVIKCKSLTSFCVAPSDGSFLLPTSGGERPSQERRM